MSHVKFYTGRGDSGTTERLGGRQRLSKSAALFEALGALDEANAALGWVRSRLEDAELQATLLSTQQRLSRLMAHLAATPELRARYGGLTDADVKWLEAKIAALTATLQAPQEFVMPGATSTEATAQLARAIIRRAERHLVALAELEPRVGAANLAFLNRLSSLLFVVALRARFGG
ncbi:MAG: cob(I)yrinic acid a,c-diamide adenosyltransferase [Chloroflexota bacterium]|nr:cob(I)yrinic acid a,c-diamide adenosyltransferase [Chloroflexota bacterium]